VAGISHTYSWTPSTNDRFRKITLLQRVSLKQIPRNRRVKALLRACLSHGSEEFFFGHHVRAEVLLTAIVLRLLGRRVYVMLQVRR
jgi:hypothetical protein